MEPKFKNSFIPKRPIVVQERRAKIARVNRGNSIFSYLPIIVFLIAVVLSGGVYAYRIALEGQINSQISKLEEVKKSLESPFVSDASRLSDRLSASATILSSHLSPTEIFRLLERSTYQTVSFDTFKFSDGGDDTIKISGGGKAEGFASIVLQSDEFGRTGYMKDVIFSNLQVDDSGTVGFSFNATVSPKDFLLYEENLDRPVLEVETEGATTTEVEDVEQIIDSEFEGFDDF